jgi:hypothetical protein
MRLAVAFVVLAGCQLEPSIVITSPAPGTRIEGHPAVPIGLTVTGDHLVSASLRCQGVVVSEVQVPDDCTSGCDLTIPWDGDAAHEGPQQLTVEVEDEHGQRAQDTIELSFDDTPTAAAIDPGETVGRTTVEVAANVIDRSQVSVALEVDGAIVGSGSTVGDCRTGCLVSVPWDTTAATNGTHAVALVVDDQHGHVVRAEQPPLRVGDIAYATAIEVTQEYDWGNLDVEIHLFDATTGEHLGCAGALSGLERVDASDVSYPVLAWFVDPAGATLPMSALAGRQLDVQVWEDDYAPCPAWPADGDDPIGASGAMSSIASVPRTFGNVVDLELAVGRPL